MTILYKKMVASPLGDLCLIASDVGLRLVGFENKKQEMSEVQTSNNHPVLLKAEKQLGEYFLGKRHVFDIPLEMKGTVFQIKAWRALQTIPFGHTLSYGEQARRLGNSNAARAVGGANNQNPLPIIVPCHRVVGADGSLTGYAGGINRKQKLLQLEQQ